MHLSQTDKTRMMAIFIVVVMLLSTAGFAIIGQPAPAETPGTPALDNNIVSRDLTGQELVAVLRSGRLAVKYVSPEGGEQCTKDSAELRQFASAYKEFVFLQDIRRNETALTVVGFDGRIADLSNVSISQDSLLDYLCASGGLKPKECVLRDIGRPVGQEQQ